jgi:hypothetical protein
MIFVYLKRSDRTLVYNHRSIHVLFSQKEYLERYR